MKFNNNLAVDGLKFMDLILRIQGLCSTKQFKIITSIKLDAECFCWWMNIETKQDSTVKLLIKDFLT